LVPGMFLLTCWTSGPYDRKRKMKPIKKKPRISTMIVESIEQMISTENLQPGDKLPSEHQMAGRLGVSRTSVREAVRMLELSGRVTVRQGKGIFLSEPVVGWFENHQESIQELFDVRTLVESHAACRAAKVITLDQVAAFDTSLKAYEKAIQARDIDTAIQLDKAFHRKIAVLSGNFTLRQIMETIVSELSKGWICSLQVPERLSATVGEHRRIIEALRARDFDAASVEMKTHLENALRDIKRYYERAENHED